MELIGTLLRLIWELAVYLVTVLPDMLPIILYLATPLALGALCGVIGERSGVVNIGIEGIMLMAAFFGYLTGFALHSTIGSGPSLALGIVVAVFVGALLGLVHAWLTVSVRADQIIAGTMMNIAAFGVTGYLNRLIITPSGLGGAGVIAPFHLPDTLANLPLIGPILVMFLDQGPIAMSVLFIVILLQIALFRTKWGLRTRAVGEHPKAADTVGIDVHRQRYQNVIFGCALAGLAGAFLTLESTGSFQNGMTGGRGFIALAAMIFGRWTPLGAFGGALLFGTATALGVVINVRVPEGDLGTVLKYDDRHPGGRRGSIDAARRGRCAVRERGQGLDDAELVERAMEIRGVAIDAERAGGGELIPAIPAREQSDAQHPRAPRGEEVPHRVADHVAVADFDAELLLASQKKVGLGLCAENVASVDDHGLGWNPEGRERPVDLGVPPRGGDAVGDLLFAQPAQELDRAGQRPALWQELAEELAVARLDPASVGVAERPADLAGDGAGEEAPAHPDPTVDLPPVDRQAGLRERTLPRENVRVDGVDQGPVEIENERTHPLLEARLRSRRDLTAGTTRRRLRL